MTKTTLRHAKELNLLPSVTTILKCLNKPALNIWKMEQVILAVFTTPRFNGEDDDAFVKRVLSVDREQDKEAAAAAKLGTEIHNALENAIHGRHYDKNLKDYIKPVLKEVDKFGVVMATELTLVGDGYAGKTDLICVNADSLTYTVVDFKTTKKLPKESHKENRLQLAAYSYAYKMPEEYIRQTCNIYISTVEAGKIAVCINTDVEETYRAFHKLVGVWQWVNEYKPEQQ
jgi:hypothetical protein